MMKLISKFILLGILILACSNSFAEESPVIGRYLIGPGDVLDISVWKDDALTRTVTVLPDGRISFPLIGEVQAAGKSLVELDDELKKRLSRYVPDLTLSILVAQVNSMHIYVLGRVNRPGRFVLNAKLNVLQALAMAGGLNPFAKSRDVLIFRETEEGTKVYSFDYKEVTHGEHLTQNIQIERGDVIVAQ